MTPLTKEERDAILNSHPAAEPGEIENDLDEYERLVAMQFASDPSLAAAPAPELLSTRRTAESRLSTLHQKLFGILESR